MKHIRAKGKKEAGGLVPLADRVLVREEMLSAETSTTSGIIIPETVSDDKGAKKGKVVAVGKGRYVDGKLVPVEVNVGDTVLFSWGDKVKISDVEYYIVNESNVIAVVNH